MTKQNDTSKREQFVAEDRLGSIALDYTHGLVRIKHVSRIRRTYTRVLLALFGPALLACFAGMGNAGVMLGWFLSAILLAKLFSPGSLVLEDHQLSSITPIVKERDASGTSFSQRMAAGILTATGPFRLDTLFAQESLLNSEINNMGRSYVTYLGFKITVTGEQAGTYYINILTNGAYSNSSIYDRKASDYETVYKILCGMNF